jgi:small nuclear ribonucleoprotein (snRNP)-like protein
MSERGAFRGRGGGRGGGDRGGRGGGRGGAQAGGAAGQTERPKKENILDLNKYMDKRITVKFSGGREGKSHDVEGGIIPHNVHGQCKEQPKLTSHAVIGTLKGYDQLMNLVLDEVKEALTGMHRESFPLTKLILCRRRQQHPLSQTRPHCRARHPPRSHLARRRQRRDPEPLHTGGRVSTEHRRG